MTMPWDKRVVTWNIPCSLRQCPHTGQRAQSPAQPCQRHQVCVPPQGRGTSQGESWLRLGAELSPGHRVQLSVCPCSGTTAIDCQRFACVRPCTAGRQLPWPLILCVRKARPSIFKVLNFINNVIMNSLGACQVSQAFISFSCTKLPGIFPVSDN